MNEENAMDDQHLWNRIQALPIGPADASLTFSQRLARENAWSPTFADKVIFEYKRFIYLVAISNQAVTPSDQVDQAWHLHLTYTRSYWKELCEGILGFELHHNPTQGGFEQQRKFKGQYIHTLSLYEATFGEKPPEDVWPALEKRFAALEAFVRVNRQQAWIIGKPALSIEMLSAFLVLPILLVACTDNFVEGDIWFWLKVAFGVYILYKLFSWLDSGGGRGGNSGGGGCGACGGCGGCGD